MSCRRSRVQGPVILSATVVPLHICMLVKDTSRKLNAERLLRALTSCFSSPTDSVRASIGYYEEKGASDVASQHPHEIRGSTAGFLRSRPARTATQFFSVLLQQLFGQHVSTGAPQTWPPSRVLYEEIEGISARRSFAFDLSPWVVETPFEYRVRWKEKQDRQKTTRHAPQVSACGSHNSMPQSEHCVLAVLEQE